MTAVEGEQYYDMAKMEKWLENYFLNPLTSYYDQTQFQIDLYETGQEWIVEASLCEYKPSEISVHVKNNLLVVTGKKGSFSLKRKEQIRLRSIEFPFRIDQQRIAASFQNGILEVYISKEEKSTKQNRTITFR